MKLIPWTYAYKLLGRKLERILPHFRELYISLKKGGVRIAFAAYLSFMMMGSLIVFVVTMIFSIILIPIFFHMEMISIQNLALSTMFSALASILTFIMLYVYPGIKSNNRKIPIETNLPYISSFLTLLSSSNVPPRTIFQSISKIDTLTEVRQEFSNIVRDVEIFGQDLMTSITENVKYTPSDKLREILNGYVSTVKTGGNPTDYLRLTTENIIKERMVKLDLMLESLSGMAEIYIMVLVAMPLLFVAMFATLGMLGGGGTMNPALLLYVLVYVGIPILATILITIISTFNVR